MNIINCYEKCENYHYFDETNTFHCTDNYTCPNNYKLIEDKNKCIDNCKNDNIYKYEYNNKCFNACQNGTYLLVIDEEYFYFNNTPKGYYFDNEKEEYKECFNTCKEC